MIAYSISKDKRVRHTIAAFELKRTRAQFLAHNLALDLASRQRLLSTRSNRLAKAMKFTVKNRNRCVMTGRSKAIFRYFKISRIMIKQLASRGCIAGLRKSSW